MNAPLALTPAGTLRRAQPWLGTLVGIEAAGLPAGPLGRAVERAFHAVARVHRAMSIHAPKASCRSSTAARTPARCG